MLFMLAEMSNLSFMVVMMMMFSQTLKSAALNGVEGA